MYKLGIRFFSRISVSVRPLEISKLQPTRTALTLSPAAVKQIGSILSQKAEIQALRINLRTRGCNGLAYTLDLAAEKDKFDEEVNQDGVRIFIAPKAMMRSNTLSPTSLHMGNCRNCMLFRYIRTILGSMPAVHY